MSKLIELKDVDITAGQDTVINGLSMDVESGESIYVIGKVGTGKTSLIRALIAEQPLAAGSGKVCGYELNGISDREIPMLRRRTGVVFQDFKLLSDRNVHDNLEFVLKATGWKSPGAIEHRISEVLEAVGMETKAHKMPSQLSGGEQQRVAVARAILNEPELILADEPTGNLDSETATEIVSLLEKLRTEKGTAVVFVTHNQNLIRRHCGRTFVCDGTTCKELSRDEPIVLNFTI